MRAAKERKRLDHGPREEVPRLTRWHPFEFGFREQRRPQTESWIEFRSLRDTLRRLRIVLRYYQPRLRTAL